MASTFFVKVYYRKNNQEQPEIRRFAIDIAQDNNVYQELCTKIATYQPDIQLTGFTLQYIDDENERITFSSNDELRSAISSNKDVNAFKIFVTPNQPQTTTATATTTKTLNRECHTGVTCDGCQGPVVGSRYRCATCPNYDLCEKCSSSGFHSEHNMIKISRPGNFYHPYGSRHYSRRHRFLPSSSFVPNFQFLEQIQQQIPQWLPDRENVEHVRHHFQHHLENVGGFIQRKLSLEGINCDYHVEDQSASSNEPSAVPKTPETTSNQGVTSQLNQVRTTSEQSQPTVKAVEECVEKMKELGFNEVDDQLMEIIRSKKGDLNQVLDVINKKD